MKKRTLLIRGFGALEKIFRSSIHDEHFAPKAALIEAQRTVFRTLHRRFLEKSQQGEKGIDAALEALDSIWSSVRNLSDAAPFIVETLSTTTPHVQLRLQDFYQESTKLLEDGIRVVFSEDIAQLTIPPQRMAKLIRILLEGLLIELMHAQNEEQLEQLDQAYADFRMLFRSFVLQNPHPMTQTNPQEGIVLPW